MVEEEFEEAVWEGGGGGCAELLAREERRGDIQGDQSWRRGL
jgi:hypothetical protein